MSALAVTGLRYRYAADAPWVLDGVDLGVEAGEVVLLEGASGSGKSSLLRVLGGLAPAFHGGEAAGRATAAGCDLRSAAPAEVARHVGSLFQDPETQAVMAEPLRDVAFGLQCHGMAAETILPAARTALGRLQADHLAGRRIDELSSGERQRVALAAVLAPEPAVLLLDEPTAQLDDDAACELAGELRRLADAGLAIVIAEHRRDRIEHLADRVVALDGGRLVPPVERRSLAPLAQVPAVGAPLLELAGLDAARAGRPVLAGVSAALPAGGVAALLGRNGGGKSTLLRAIAGLETSPPGSVRVAGADVTGLAPEKRVPRIGFVPQDPGRLLLSATVRDEVLLGPRTAGCGDAAADRAIRDLDIGHLLDRNPRDCSVGERERIAIAAVLALDPDVLLLDEPTRGMDPGHRSLLVAAVRAHAGRGGCAVVATHDLELARACADRRWTVDAGRLASEATG